jgi:hypothetical protein
MLIDALRDNFIALFGEEQYTKLRADVVAGRDGVVEVPDDIYHAYLAECLEEATMSKFRPRSHRGRPVPVTICIGDHTPQDPPTPPALNRG